MSAALVVAAAWTVVSVITAVPVCAVLRRRGDRARRTP